MESQFKCNVCSDTFGKVSQLKRHTRIHHPPGQFVCFQCSKSFSRAGNLKRHMNRHDDDRLSTCGDCGTLFSRPDALRRHCHVQHGGGKRTQEEEQGPSTKQTKYADVKDHYHISHVKETYNSKFKTTSQYYNIKIKDLEIDNLAEIITTLHEIFESIIEELTANIEPHHLVQLSVQSPSLDFPITVPYVKRTNLTAELFLSTVERTLQSFEEFVLDDQLEVNVTHVEVPIGKGKKRRSRPINLNKYLDSKKSVIRIRNRDELCCARAIVVAKARIDKHEKYISIRQGWKIQRDLAVALHRRAGVPLRACGIEQVKQFQATLTDYQIHVLSKDDLDTIVYYGPEAQKKIYLYHYDSHFDVITSLPAFFNRNYFCHICKKPYNHPKDHKCVKTCGCCYKEHPKNDNDKWILCDDCNRYFKGETCYNNHSKVTQHGNSTCQTYNRCKECGKRVNVKKNKNHRCGELYCKTCREYVLQEHKCFMKPATNTNSNRKKTLREAKTSHTESSESQMINKDVQDGEDITTFIFYDFECSQDTGIHRPNLCVAQKVCEWCLSREEDECEHCGIRQHVFYGNQSSTDFCKWIFSGENAGAICICHNFKAYDSYFILQYLYDNAVVPKVIMTGSKVMSIDVAIGKIKFIDSINFIPMALAKLPSTFGLDDECKQFFPHLFNTDANQTSQLPHLPDAKFYNPDSMKAKDRDKFYEWYSKHKHDPFELKEELVKYCVSDVNILRKGSLKFRQLFIDMTESAGEPGIDPFKSCITIVSACSLVYRTKFLRPETVAIIPPVTHSLQTHSIKAMTWLKYVSERDGIQIQHARNGGEVRIGPYLVDGYYELQDKKVCMEFNGCVHHSCQTCYAKVTTSPINGRSMKEIYQETLDKQKFIQRQGYVLITMWECSWDRQIKEDVTIKNFVNGLNIVSALNPRDAFYGGRTEAFTLYHEAKENEHIKYVDYTSLYPFVNKTCKYPIGHPTQITENFDDVSQYEGLIKCRVLPPRHLHLPVLPARINGKLMFALCRSCTELQQNVCDHNDDERAITGTWVSDELHKAIEKGYRLMDLYEVWHFDQVSQYNPDTKEGGLFTEYINTFLRIKQEASGFPDWADTEHKKQEYIRQYEEREGIRLQYYNIKYNPGLRALAKLMLNSMWGKLAQRSNLPQTSHFTNPADYYDLMTSTQQQVHSVRFVNESMVEAQWSYKEEFVTAASRTNVVLAAYTTAHARLKLYGLMESLDDRLLYVDTDSAIFRVSDGLFDPELGDYLGDLTSEIGNNTISQFVSAGAKNYAFKLTEPDKDGNSTQCKVRGITLNFLNSLKINLETMKDMVRGIGASTISVVDEHKIVRDKNTTNILTKKMCKTYKLVFDKRVIVDNYKTVPYGYIA